MWCVKLMICRDACQVVQMWYLFGRSCSGSVGLGDLQPFSHASLSPACWTKWHVTPNLSAVTCPRFWCEARCISCIRFNTWSLHLWFRKPRTEAKDSLGGVGGNVDLCRPGNPHKWLVAVAPSFPPHPPFFPLTRRRPLDYYFFASWLLCLDFSLCTIVSCALHLANNTSVENSEECILLLRWVILPLACMPLPQGGWMRGWWG